MASQIQFDVVISYSQESGTECMKKLHEKLKERGYKVWVDVEQVHGRISDQAAEGVASAFIIVPLVSEAYAASPYCELELKQAEKAGKAIVPVKIERYHPPESSWLSLILSDRYHYKMYGDFDETDSLIVAIKEELKKCKAEMEGHLMKVKRALEQAKDVMERMKGGETQLEVKWDTKEVRAGLAEVRKEVEDVKEVMTKNRKRRLNCSSFRPFEKAMELFRSDTAAHSDSSPVTDLLMRHRMLKLNQSVLEQMWKSFDHEEEKRRIDELKKIYNCIYRMHHIHTVAQHGKILLKEVNISDFFVQLKISQDVPPKHTSISETSWLFKGLNNAMPVELELSQVAESDHRVVFIRGIAGMGKTVLSKHLACSWAKGDMLVEFKYCIMFQCKELNYFVAQKRSNHSIHEELLTEFLKVTFNCRLGEGKEILFVIDGLDELYDIKETDSIIAPLLIGSICGNSKIIITGRPHIESIMGRYVESGSLKTIEIQGLTDEQIKKYIEQFCDIKSMHGTLDDRVHSLLHVPQFLNTICCVSLFDSSANEVLLYCWVLYLWLIQHAEKQTTYDRSISYTFQQHSIDLLCLSNICHHLINDEKVVVDSSELEFSQIWKMKEFYISLFADVSDNKSCKYQFQLSSLMEFLSAVHMFGHDYQLKGTQKEAIKFLHQLREGFKDDGIIKSLLSNLYDEALCAQMAKSIRFRCSKDTDSLIRQHPQVIEKHGCRGRIEKDTGGVIALHPQVIEKDDNTGRREKNEALCNSTVKVCSR